MEETLPINKVCCLSCKFETSKEYELLDHIKIHIHESNFRIPCIRCPAKLKNLKTYRRHKKKCNKKIKATKQKLVKPEEHEIECFWNCEICDHKELVGNKQSSTDFGHVKTHLSKHSKNKEIVKCPSTKCPMKSYHKYGSLNAHLNQHIRRNQFELQNVTQNLLENEPITDNLNESFSSSESSTETQNRVDLTVEPNEFVEDIPNNAETDAFALHSAIMQKESMFALKLSGKYLLTQEVITEIFQFSNEVHSMKLELINAQLTRMKSDKEIANIKEITESVNLIDQNIGLKDELTTHYRRQKHLRQTFDFVEEERIPIKDPEKIKKDSFYYQLPIRKTLTRFLKDETLRRFIIQSPVFFKHKVSFLIKQGKVLYFMIPNGSLISQDCFTMPTSAKWAKPKSRGGWATGERIDSRVYSNCTTVVL